MGSDERRPMTATNERTGTPRPSRQRHARRHEDAVIQAEVRGLARALSPYRVLPRDALRRASGADSWREGGFERALSAAVEAGRIKRLPSDFYAYGDPAPRIAGDGSS
jgi:hypothetical protein